MQETIRAHLNEYYERLLIWWTPKNIVDEDSREKRVRRLLRWAQRVITSYVAFAVFGLLILCLIWWWNPFISTHKAALVGAPEFSTWIDVKHLDEIANHLIAPPFKNMSSYQSHAHACVAHASIVRELGQRSSVEANDGASRKEWYSYAYNNGDDLVTRWPHLKDVYALHERSRRFVSLSVIAQAMVNAYGDRSDTRILCTYMFGNWSSLVTPLPCMCVGTEERDQSVLFEPSISMQSPTTVRARVRSVMGFVSPLESNVSTAVDKPMTLIRSLPKTLQVSFDRLQSYSSRSPISTDPKTLDRHSNQMRQYAYIHMAHITETLVNVADVNVWTDLCIWLRSNWHLAGVVTGE